MEFAYVPIMLAILAWAVVRITEAVYGKKLIGGTSLEQLQAENQDLKQRIENLETLVSGLDTELLEDLSQLKNLENPKTKPSSSVSVEENLKSLVNKLIKKLDSKIDPKS